MHPLALLSKQAKKLDGFAVSAGEPVRRVGAEFRGFARAKVKVLVAQHQTQSSIEDVKPFIALVNARVGLFPAAIAGEHHLEGLLSERLAGDLELVPSATRTVWVATPAMA